MSDDKLFGIAVRARWLGFAVMDTHRRLLDWGMIFYQRRSATELKSAKKRLEAHLARMNPSHVVLVLPGTKANEEIAPVRSITRALHAAAASCSIQIVTLPRTAIREAFAPCDAKAKREIASLLVRAFPEIAWKLPPERKIWAKEDSRMALFDALAGAIAHHKHQFRNTACDKRPGSIESSGRPHGDV
jgi:hypothetical protein